MRAPPEIMTDDKALAPDAQGDGPEADFARGDYHAAARSPRDCWQKFAGLALLGLARQALDGLEHYEGAWPRFFRAAALWIGGRSQDAVKILREVDLPAASALARLVSKGSIKVLAQLPYLRYGPQVVRDGIGADRTFRLVNYSFNPEDRQARPESSVFDWFDTGDPPDFYICSMLEWHIPPRDIHAAPFPILAQTADTDLHSQALRRWLPSFDALLVADASEHAMVSRIVPRTAVAAAPSPFGWRHQVGLTPVRDGDRPIDVFMSGIMLRPFFPDKARLLIKLLSASGLEVLVVDGALDRRKYLELMARAKTTLCYTRNSGAMVTRGIEALAMGSIPVIPAGNVIKLWMPQHCGFEYAPDFGDVVERVRAAVAEFPRIDPKAQARQARAAFAPKRMASVYMRTLTVHAALAMSRNAVRQHDLRRDTRRNSQFIMWPIPFAGAATDVFAHNVRTFRARLKQGWSAEAANLLAREYIIECAEGVRRSEPNQRLPRLRYALRVLRMAIAREPQRLVLWLNLIRATVFLGDAPFRALGAAWLTEALAKDHTFWRVSVHDDVLPPDYFDNLLDRFAYFDLLKRVPVGQDADEAGVEPALVRCILASLYWLAGWLFVDEKRFAVAQSLHPDHGTVALDSAIAALRREEAPSKDALAALRLAAEGSCLFAQAAQAGIFGRSRLAGRVSEAEISRWRALADGFERSVVPVEPVNYMRGVGRFLCFGTPPAPQPAKSEINGRSVSLVVCDFEPLAAARAWLSSPFEALSFASRTRVAPFHHPGLKPGDPNWRFIVGNTLNTEPSDLLARAIAELRSDEILVLFDPQKFLGSLKDRVFARLGQRATTVLATSGGAAPSIIGFACARSTFLKLPSSARLVGASGLFDPYDVVRRLRAGRIPFDIVAEPALAPFEPAPPQPTRPLCGARRVLDETLSRKSWRTNPVDKGRAIALQAGSAAGVAIRRAGRAAAVRIHAFVGAMRSDAVTSLFDAAWYRSRYPDAAASALSPLEHFLQIGTRERRNPHPLFDTDWYLAQCPEAAHGPVQHYLRRGAFQGLDPNPWFDTDWYASQNPGASLLGLNPLVHFIRRGAARGRRPCPAFDIAWYRRHYGVAAGVNPLAHYLRNGAARGLHPNQQQLALAAEGFAI